MGSWWRRRGRIRGRGWWNVGEKEGMKVKPEEMVREEEKDGLEGG